ncbi:hypothetical protein BH20GEM1_BH20GEM1_13200 [soil metagenome]
MPVPRHVAAGREDDDRVSRRRSRLVDTGREKGVGPDAGVHGEVGGDPRRERVGACLQRSPHRLEIGKVRSVSRVWCGSRRVPELGDELPPIARFLGGRLVARIVDPVVGDRPHEVWTGGLGKRDHRVRPRDEVSEPGPRDRRLSVCEIDHRKGGEAGSDREDGA